MAMNPLKHLLEEREKANKTFAALQLEKSKKSKLIGTSRMGADTYLLGRAKLINSELSEMAMVMDSAVLEDSRVSHLGKVMGQAVAQKSYIGGQALLSGRAGLINSAAFNSAILTDNAGALDSLIYDRAIMMDDAFAVKSHIGGNVTLTGDVIVHGLTLEDDEYLTEGIWSEKPLHFNFKMMSHFGLPLGITESIGDRWTIGCTTFEFDFWMRHSKFVQKKLQLTDIQIHTYIFALEELKWKKNKRDRHGQK